jgi:hypothetical protein
MSSTRKGLLLVSLLLAAALVLPGCVTISDGGGIGIATTDTYDATFPVTPGARLDVQNRNGSISMVATDGDSIVIHAVKSTNYGKSEFDKVRIDVEQGDPFTIATTVLREPARVSISYELQVPRSMLVRSAVTTNGNVTLRGVTAVSGAATTNGTVECEVAALDGTSVDIHTTNGNATVWVTPDLPATLDVSTTNGNLTVEDISLDNATASKRHIRGDLGTPRGELSVRTTNGNVTINKLNP